MAQRLGTSKGDSPPPIEFQLLTIVNPRHSAPIVSNADE
jgi:hypothetical protein